MRNYDVLPVVNGVSTNYFDDWAQTEGYSWLGYCLWSSGEETEQIISQTFMDQLISEEKYISDQSVEITDSRITFYWNDGSIAEYTRVMDTTV